MSRVSKIEIQILSGRSDANINFADLYQILNKFCFNERIKSIHRIFTMTGVEEIINIPPIGSKAKAYQVKQVRNLILKYKLGVSDE